MSLRKRCSFLVCCVIILMYYKVNNIEEQIKKPSFFKKIVGFSLRKQIELDGREMKCEKVANHEINTTRSAFWNKVPNLEIFVASVYLDLRLEPYKYLRIIAASKGTLRGQIYCQIVLKSGHVRIVRATVKPIWYEKWNVDDNNSYYNPMLISCRVPESDLVPNPCRGISLSKKPCDPIYKMFDIDIPKDLKDINFTLCIKPLNYVKDISMHLVKWIEISKILGVQNFYFFVKNVTEKTRKILKWYNSQYPKNFHVENFMPIETACQDCGNNEFYPHVWQQRRYEIIAYNKCFYSNLNSQYIIPLDIDELIVPKIYKNWFGLMKQYGDANVSSFIVQNVYFFTKNNDAFKSKFRVKFPSGQGENSKSFISTKNALTVFNHYSLHSLRPGTIRNIFLPFKDVQLNHYKESCDRRVLPECGRYYVSSPLVFDNIIDRYKSKFEKEYRRVIDNI